MTSFGVHGIILMTTSNGKVLNMKVVRPFKTKLCFFDHLNPRLYFTSRAKNSDMHKDWFGGSSVARKIGGRFHAISELNSIVQHFLRENPSRAFRTTSSFNSIVQQFCVED